MSWAKDDYRAREKMLSLRRSQNFQEDECKMMGEAVDGRNQSVVLLVTG